MFVSTKQILDCQTKWIANTKIKTSVVSICKSVWGCGWHIVSMALLYIVALLASHFSSRLYLHQCPAVTWVNCLRAWIFVIIVRRFHFVLMFVGLCIFVLFSIFCLTLTIIADLLIKHAHHVSGIDSTTLLIYSCVCLFSIAAVISHLKDVLGICLLIFEMVSVVAFITVVLGVHCVIFICVDIWLGFVKVCMALGW